MGKIYLIGAVAFGACAYTTEQDVKNAAIVGLAWPAVLAAVLCQHIILAAAIANRDCHVSEV